MCHPDCRAPDGDRHLGLYSSLPAFAGSSIHAGMIAFVSPFLYSMPSASDGRSPCAKRKDMLIMTVFYAIVRGGLGGGRTFDGFVPALAGRGAGLPAEVSQPHRL